MSKRTSQAPATGNKPAAGAADAAGADASAGRPAFPMNAVLRNHASIAFPEPVTGAYLSGGGSAHVILHDEEHAEQVVESLKNIAETNFLAPDALVVEPA